MQRNSNHYHLYPIITKNNLKDRVLVPHIPQLEQKLGEETSPIKLLMTHQNSLNDRVSVTNVKRT